MSRRKGGAIPKPNFDDLDELLERTYEVALRYAFHHAPVTPFFHARDLSNIWWRYYGIAHPADDKYPGKLPEFLRLPFFSDKIVCTEGEPHMPRPDDQFFCIRTLKTYAFKWFCKQPSTVPLPVFNLEPSLDDVDFEGGVGNVTAAPARVLVQMESTVVAEEPPICDLTNKDAKMQPIDMFEVDLEATSWQDEPVKTPQTAGPLNPVSPLYHLPSPEIEDAVAEEAAVDGGPMGILDPEDVEIIGPKTPEHSQEIYILEDIGQKRVVEATDHPVEEGFGKEAKCSSGGPVVPSISNESIDTKTDKTEESGAEKSGRSREFNREDMRRDHIEERESHRNPENTEFAYPESPPIQPPASPNENAFKEASEAPAQSVFIHRMEVALAECHNHASPRKLATAYWRIYAGDFDNDFTKAYGGIPISEAVRDTGIEYDREKGSEGTFALRHMKGDAPCSHSTSKRKRKKPLYESDDGEEEANEIVKKRREMDEEAPLPGCNAEDKRNYLREIDSHHPSANNNDGKKPEKTEKSFDGEDEPEKESSSDNNWTQSENALFDYYEDDLELPTTEPDHYRFRGYFKDEIKETLESLPAQWVSWPNLVAAHKESGLYTCNLPMLESASKFYDDACIRTYLAVFIEMRPGKKKEDRLFCLRSRLDEVAEPADPISPLKNTPLPCTPEREEDQEPVPDSPLKPPPTPVPMESPEKERPYGPLLPMPVSVRQPILQPERYSSPEPEGSLGSSSSDSSSSSSCSSCSSSSSSSSSSSWSTYSVERVVTLKETPKSSRSRRSLRNARSRSGSYRSPSGNGNRRKSRSRSRTRLRRDRRSSSRPRRHSRTRRRSRSRQRDQRDVASPTGDSTSSHLTLWGPKFIELKRDSRSPSSTAGKRKDHRWSSSSPSDSPRKRRGSYRRRSRSRDRSSIRTPSIMQERLAKIYKEQEVAATRPPSPNHAKKRKEGSKAAEKSDDGEDFTNKIPKKAEKVEKQLPSVQKPAAGPLKLQQKIKIKLSCEANPESCDFLETPRASDATKKDKVSATQRFATKLAKLKARVMKK